MLSLAIHTNSKIDQQIMLDIRRAFVDNIDSQVFDFFIFSDDIKSVTNYNIATLSTFYMEFYKDYLIFTDLTAYLVYRNRLLTKHVFLYIPDMLNLPTYIDRNILTDFKAIFTMKNNNLSVVKL